jgi:ABC-type multidrug transport system fused ATPase/permease subunit
MRKLPLTDPGIPDTRSPARFLLWVARRQRATLIGSTIFGVTWMAGQAVTPFVVGKAIDTGVTARDTSALVKWAAILLGLGMLQALAGVLRHRFGVANWLIATFRCNQLLVRHAVRLGGSLPDRVPTGDAVNTGTTDIVRVGRVMDMWGRAAGAFASLLLVAVIVLLTSLPLGLLVLLGVPVLVLCVGALLRPLHRFTHEQRRKMGELTTLGTDTVVGLRVLRGIGGEDTFLRRYRDKSQDVRRAGISVARVSSLLDAAEVLLPGLFVVVLTWIGARMTLSGQITIGQLVALYGYAAFLVSPLRTATEAADAITRGLVSARRILNILTLKATLTEPAQPAAPPEGDAVLVDTASGLRVQPGLLTAVVAAMPEETTALADRVGRYTDTGAPVLIGEIDLRRLPLSWIREHILVSTTDPRLFSGRLREELDPHHTAGRERIASALHTAAAEDILEALPHGLDSRIDERGRSFSGGQRQRIALARALLADPQILVLDQPTSAVDAHTETRIAERLRAARANRTTLVMTSSPLLLDRADHVALLSEGRVIAEGTHRELFATHAAYRATVTRQDSDLAEVLRGGV